MNHNDNQRRRLQRARENLDEALRDYDRQSHQGSGSSRLRLYTEEEERYYSRDLHRPHRHAYHELENPRARRFSGRSPGFGRSEYERRRVGETSHSHDRHEQDRRRHAQDLHHHAQAARQRDEDFDGSRRHAQAARQRDEESGGSRQHAQAARRRDEDFHESRRHDGRDGEQNRPQDEQQRREDARDRHQQDLDGPERRRNPPPVPRHWRPMFRNLGVVMGETSEGARHLDHAEDRLLEVLNLENPPRIETWEEAGLNHQLIKNIEQMGFTQPREAQKLMVPLIHQGYDIAAHCETGGGKTAAVAIPVIQKILEDPEVIQDSKASRTLPLAIIVAPTRELAHQLCEQYRALSKELELSVVLSYGQMDGGNIRRQMEQKSVQILIGTCGRVTEHIQCGHIDVSALKVLVLDEADQMIAYSMNKVADLTTLFAQTRLTHVIRRTQLIMSSATTCPKLEIIKERFSKSQTPLLLIRGKEEKMNSRITVKFVKSQDDEEKIRQLVEILEEDEENENRGGVRKTLVFINRRENCGKVAEMLKANQVEAKILSGDMRQDERELRLREFREGRCNVLLATNLLSRGIDIHGLERVVVFDLPPGGGEISASTFEHRIGRIGRLTQGVAYVLINVYDRDNKLPIISIVDFLENKNGCFIPEWLQRFVESAQAAHPELRVVRSVQVEEPEKKEDSGEKDENLEDKEDVGVVSSEEHVDQQAHPEAPKQAAQVVRAVEEPEPKEDSEEEEDEDLEDENDIGVVSSGEDNDDEKDDTAETKESSDEELDDEDDIGEVSSGEEQVEEDAAEEKRGAGEDERSGEKVDEKVGEKVVKDTAEDSEDLADEEDIGEVSSGEDEQIDAKQVEENAAEEKKGAGEDVEDERDEKVDKKVEQVKKDTAEDSDGDLDDEEDIGEVSSGEEQVDEKVVKDTAEDHKDSDENLHDEEDGDLEKVDIELLDEDGSSVDDVEIGKRRKPDGDGEDADGDDEDEDLSDIEVLHHE